MKGHKKLKKYILIIIIFILSFVIFSIIFGFFGKNYIKKEETDEGPPTPPVDITIPDSKKITLFHNGEIIELGLSDYLVGVVAAEMPGNFELEALKAQAVAARTYTLRKEKYGNDKHPGAVVCSDFAHCKAYISHEDMKSKGDEWMAEFYPKMVKSVTETEGEIITYDNEPISAVFFSTSSGITENAKDVWGGDIPYLVSVKSEGDEESPRYTDEVLMTFSEFKEKINSGSTKINFTDNPSEWITNIKRNESDSVNSLDICGVTIKGTDIRSLLGIRSTSFSIEALQDNMVIKTKGFGHGVGMSQWGANHMAKMGYSHKDILKKYYTGVTVE